MKEITLRHEQPQIKIDGIIFSLRMADYDVIKLCNDMFHKYEGYSSKEHSVTEILVDLAEIRSTIDEILGEGAMLKLSLGLPVGMKLAIEWVGAISQAVNEMYVENAIQ